MSNRRYIWIVRWDEFQHYKPNRERGPAWIKDYTAQLSDDRYLRLSDRQRALLRDLRDVFATFRGRLPDDTRMITRQRCSQTRRSDLDALNHAGFIVFLSRESLELALEKFYSRSRSRSREEKNRDVDGDHPAFVNQEPEPEPEPELPLRSDDIDFNGNGAGAGAGIERKGRGDETAPTMPDPNTLLERIP